MANDIDYVFASLFAIIFGEMTVYCLFMSFVHFLFFPTVEFWETFMHCRQYLLLDKLFANIFLQSVSCFLSFSVCICICVCICLVFSSLNRLYWRAKAFNLKRFNLLFFFFPLRIMFLKPNLRTLCLFQNLKFLHFFQKTKKN